MVTACVWRGVEVVGVGDVACLFPVWAFVWGNVDPHGCSLCTCESDCSAILVEVGATSLFECLG